MHIKKTFLLPVIILPLIFIACGGDDIDEPTNSTSNNTSNNIQDTTIVTVHRVSFKMIKVHGGTFTMGATSEQGNDANSDEKPAHQVTLSDYYIGQTEVTQALWDAVMDNNPSHFTGDMNRPVENVSYGDCQTFISKLNKLTDKTFRMPTEAEWEFAARGGIKSQSYKYAGSNDIKEVAWYKDNAGDKPHPVATKKANELGLYDMSGNVSEWCRDKYSSYSSDPQTNPTNYYSGYYLVYRGGDYVNRDYTCRVSSRHYASNPSNNACFNIGIRLAL